MRSARCGAVLRQFLRRNHSPKRNLLSQMALRSAPMFGQYTQRNIVASDSVAVSESQAVRRQTKKSLRHLLPSSLLQLVAWQAPQEKPTALLDQELTPSMVSMNRRRRACLAAGLCAAGSNLPSCSAFSACPSSTSSFRPTAAFHASSTTANREVRSRSTRVGSTVDVDSWSGVAEAAWVSPGVL